MRLFLNGNLQFHSRDEYRYHEALVHPALAAHGAPRKVLVLGGGDGLAVREVLKHPSVERVTLVELDPHMTRLFATRAAAARAERRRAALAEGRRSSTPTPSPGSSSNDEMFDAIVVDFPDPTNFSLGKLYTTTFYELLDRHLAAERLRGGADHLAADRAAELLDRGDARSRPPASTPTPYHAHVPSFGEWGFVVAEPAARAAPPRRCRRACASSTRRRPAARCSSSRPTWRACRPRSNRLSNQVLVHDLRGRMGQGARR